MYIRTVVERTYVRGEYIHTCTYCTYMAHSRRDTKQITGAQQSLLSAAPLHKNRHHSSVGVCSPGLLCSALLCWIALCCARGSTKESSSALVYHTPCTVCTEVQSMSEICASCRGAPDSTQLDCDSTATATRLQLGSAPSFVIF